MIIRSIWRFENGIFQDGISSTAPCWPARFPSAGFGSTPSLKFAGYKSPNEKLNFAAIGSGGQGAANISAAAAPTENIVALCDVDDRRAAADLQSLSRTRRSINDFRQMLDKEGKNIDAVIVATPDHMHATAAMWCMERGKHVYVQKPLVRTVWEARAVARGGR